MDMREWTIEFKVINGREPSPEEFLAAKANGFPSILETQSSTTVAAEQTKPLTPVTIAFRAALLLLIAGFGYVVGYLFA